jgi:hypothetical protein
METYQINRNGTCPACIDVLMNYFKHHTSEVFQRVVEKEFPNAIPTDGV